MTAHRILIIDDDGVDRLNIHRNCKNHKVPTVIKDAATIAEGLEVLSQDNFDVIILDNSLPDGTAEIAIPKIRKLTSCTPIIISTGAGEEMLAVRLLQTGAADYIPKDKLSSETLERSISNVISLAEAQKKAETYKVLLEKNNRDLAIASEHKTRFLANMSHEIRTPLNAIIGMSEYLKKSPLAEQFSKEVCLLNRESTNLLNIVNNILDMSKIESGQIEVDHSPIDVIHLLKGIFSTFEIQLRNRQVELTLDIDKKVPQFIKLDGGKLRQILINLLGNASKFTEKGSIRLKCSLHGDLINNRGCLEIKVQDSGPGIAEEAQHSIFDSFSQADASVATKFGGTGLGLSISRAFIIAMGGDIGLKSQLGEGSCFTLEIPFELASGAVVSEASSLDLDTTNSDLCRGKRILIVDDTDFNLLIIKNIFEAIGCICETAMTVKEAVELFSESEYDLVFLDIQLPDGTGHEALKKMRVIAEKKSIVQPPIIALTARAFAEDRRESLDSGFDEHLTKPFRRNDLLAAAIHFWQLDHRKTSPPDSSKAQVSQKDAPIFEEAIYNNLLTENLGGNTEVLQQLLLLFLRDAPTYLAAINEGQKLSDFDKIIHAAHTLKSNAGSLGLLQLAEISNQLENFDYKLAQPDTHKALFDQIQKVGEASLGIVNQQLSIIKKDSL